MGAEPFVEAGVHDEEGVDGGFEPKNRNGLLGRYER